MHILEQWLTSDRTDNPNEHNSCQKLYALLDCAADDVLPESVLGLDGALISQSLFNNTTIAELADSVPLLVEVNQKSEAFHYLVNNMSKYPWGYFILSEHDIDMQTVNLQEFLKTELPDGKQYLFYDLRVMFNQIRALSSEKLCTQIGQGNFLILPDVEKNYWHYINEQGDILYSGEML